VDAQLNRKSLMFGVPGIALQILSRIMTFVAATDAQGRITRPPAESVSPIWLVVFFIGTILLIVGLGLYAKAKGYSPLFGLFGLLSIIGVIVLAVLPDRLKARNSPGV
jgi:hypothetical protein